MVFERVVLSGTLVDQIRHGGCGQDPDHDEKNLKQRLFRLGLFQKLWQHCRRKEDLITIAQAKSESRPVTRAM